ncbi:MAG: hypothetical protein E7590_08600 [Ruminococcaceae bacterium]|nr:hypothetical protein [Oscillospiraceae bacterium]
MKVFHDVHIHNYLSTCSGDNGATVESYIKEAKELGLRLIGFANHTWDESVPLPASSSFYKRQSMAFQMQIKSQIPEKVEGLKVLVGAETEYCGMYDVLGMGREAALQLDFLLIPHTHVHMRNFVMPATEDVTRARATATEVFAAINGISADRAAAMAKSLSESELEPFMGEKKVDYVRHVTDFMVQSFRSLMQNETLKSYSDDIPVSIAHPFQPVGSFPLRDQMVASIPDNTFGELFEMAAKRGIGLELNSATNTAPVLHMFGIAKECGCKFTFGSDMHARGEMSKVFGAQVCADHLGLTENDMMDFTRG